MQNRCVICGKVITNGFNLCESCLREYGRDKSQYPEWLKFLIADTNREVRQERRISQREISFTDLGLYD